MKIYNKVVIDMSQGDILYEDSFEYDGDIAECKGGGGSTSTTNTQDPVYNARIAAIAEREQDIADAYFNFWEDSYKPFETAQLQANMSLLPQQTALQLGQIDAQQQLLQPELDFVQSQMDFGKDRMDVAGRSLTKMEGLTDINADERAAAASADVAQAGKIQRGALTRDAARMGATENQLFAQLGDLRRDEALYSAGAATLARRSADQEEFGRLAQLASNSAPSSGSLIGGTLGGSNNRA